MNNFEKYTFIKEKLNAPRFDNEDEEIDWFTKHLYGLYNQASRLREENNNYMARIDKYKIVLDKIKEKGVMYYDPEYSKIYGELCSMPGANNTRTPVIVIDDDILELLEEIE